VLTVQNEREPARSDVLRHHEGGQHGDAQAGQGRSTVPLPASKFPRTGTFKGPSLPRNHHPASRGTSV